MTFEQCLEKGKIKEFSQGKALIQKELQTAEKDLLDGKEGFARGKYKWTTIQSYYVMFHSARALLYNKNYREKSHYCLSIALRISMLTQENCRDISLNPCKRARRCGKMRTIMMTGPKPVLKKR